MNTSKTTLALCLTALVLFGLTGCNQATQPPPAGWYRLNVEEFVQLDDLMIVQLKIQFSGEHPVAIEESGGHDSFTISPDSKTGVSTCQVLLVADLIKFGKEGKDTKLKWLVQIRSKGGSVGGPGIYQLKEDKKIKDLVQLQIKSGEYAMGLEQELAIFRDDILTLKVGR